MHARTVVCFRRTNVASVVKVLHGCKLVQNLVVVSRVNFVRKKKTPFFLKSTVWTSEVEKMIASEEALGWKSDETIKTYYVRNPSSSKETSHLLDIPRITEEHR